jgi:hypothetical protein
VNASDKRAVKRVATLLKRINARDVSITLKTPQSTVSMDMAKQLKEELSKVRIKNEIKLKNKKVEDEPKEDAGKSGT